MTAKMTRNILLMLAATVLMGIVLNLYIHNTGTVPAADNAAHLTDGSYTSSAQGCLSEVTVTVTVTGGKVTAVQVDASAETPELGGTTAAQLCGSFCFYRVLCSRAPLAYWVRWSIWLSSG